MKWMARMVLGLAAAALMSGCGPVSEEEAQEAAEQGQEALVGAGCGTVPCPYSGPCTNRYGYAGEFDCDAYCRPICIPY